MFPILANGLYIVPMLSAAALGETHAVSLRIKKAISM
jgi:hypothetical protein